MLRLRATSDTRRALLGLGGEVWSLGLISLLSSTAESYLLFALFWAAEPQGWDGGTTALMVVVLRLPVLFTGPLLGRAVDILGARIVVLIDTAARCALMLSLAVLGGGGKLPFGFVLVVGGLAGALAPGTYAGSRSRVSTSASPMLVPRANALLGASEQLSLLLGAAVVGPAIEMLGVGRSMIVPAGMLGVASAIALRLPHRVDRLEPSSPHEAGENMGWHRRVVALLALSTAYFLAYGPFETVLPSLVREQLSGGPSLYGGLWLLFGLGALSTIAVGPQLARRRPGVINAGGAIAWGLVMLPVSVSSATPVVAAAFLIGGAVWGPYTTVEVSALQRWTPPARLGSILGAQRALLLTAAPLGAALGALALDHFEPAAILGFSAIGCSVAGLVALGSKELREAG